MINDRTTKNIINMMFDKVRRVRCISCGILIYIRYDRRYEGLLAECSTCDNQWRES